MLRSLRSLVAVTALTLAAGAALTGAQPTDIRTVQAPPPGGPPPTMRLTDAAIDSFATERDSLMNAVLAEIKGHENAPAESVFKNVKEMKNAPAGRLLRIMNMGFGRSLGVSCKHCHDVAHYDAEDKPQKQIARDMMNMVATINSELLPKIKNLKSEKPTVNCTTCHRGQVKPALNL